MDILWFLKDADAFKKKDADASVLGTVFSELPV
jgi:hypothetical protein